MFLYACRYASSSEFSTEASLKYFILGHLAQLFYYLESVLYTGVLVRFILLTLAYSPPLNAPATSVAQEPLGLSHLGY
jgi:NADH:ubiquinone oxidoreductase subunit 2 (subunit N)